MDSWSTLGFRYSKPIFGFYGPLRLFLCRAEPNWKLGEPKIVGFLTSSSRNSFFASRGALLEEIYRVNTKLVAHMTAAAHLIALNSTIEYIITFHLFIVLDMFKSSWVPFLTKFSKTWKIDWRILLGAPAGGRH